MKQLVFGSGQHRVEAVKILVPKIKSRIKSLKADIAKAQGKPGLATFEKDLAEETAKLSEATYWGVKIFDGSKLYFSYIRNKSSNIKHL
jgi:hypothetical protein